MTRNEGRGLALTGAAELGTDLGSWHSTCSRALLLGDDRRPPLRQQLCFGLVGSGYLVGVVNRVLNQRRQCNGKRLLIHSTTTPRSSAAVVGQPTMFVT